MNAPAALQLPAAIGAAFEGGRLMGALMYPSGPAALIKMHDLDPTEWGPYGQIDALSLVDGLANTRAMAKAGSKIAQQVLDMGEGLYIAAIDELDVCYRVAKPTKEETAIYGRNGINLHALPPALPYAFGALKQTELEDFKDGGSEAFKPQGYWSSTASAGDSDDAWYQWFHNGDQSRWYRNNVRRVVVVRRLPL